MRANPPQQNPLLRKGMTPGKASGLAQTTPKEEARGIEGKGSPVSLLY